MIKPTFLIFLVLLASCVALLPENSRERCLCQREGMLTVNMERVARVEYYRPTASCGREEMIVTFRNGQKRCLNPDGDQSRRIKQAIMDRNNTGKGSSN